MQTRGFLRVASVVPAVAVADVKKNAEAIYKELVELDGAGVELAVFPELCITSYTCGDLFHSTTLLYNAESALQDLLLRTAKFNLTFIVGVPVCVGTLLYNCAAVCAGGRLLALIPKTYIPNYNEFYEKRWWASASAENQSITFAGQSVMFGVRQLIKVGQASIAAEICEDVWSPIPPSIFASMAGADVICNLSASDALIGKYGYLKELVINQSARTMSAYVYAAAGFGESTTDLVYDGISLIAENGRLLQSNKRWNTSPQYMVADIDLDALAHDRMHVTSFGDCARRNNVAPQDYNTVISPTKILEKSQIFRHISPKPFVPDATDDLRDRCEEIINIQVAGLSKRLKATCCHHLVIGISGGLDSTLALLVAVRAFDHIALDRKGIVGVTMPGFGTTDRTYHNAITMMQLLGVSIREISISNAVIQHFKDIDHNQDIHDVTYENSQARERTQILMDIANQVGGMVLGTGDLSELALGWATYNGDHMSMYGVNSSVPKTLVRYLVSAFSDFAHEEGNDDLATTLTDIVATPVSPELIPADKDGNIVQKTEDLVGPYELHDFFLYYMLRYGFGPQRIYLMACQAFETLYQKEHIKYWLNVFFKRFFSQQFKRSCLPDGPKVGSVCLSPRGDWRMPSDAVASLWLDECEKL